MCHYAQLTFPVPAVIVAIVFKPLVLVDPVKPAPIVIVPAAVGKRKITTPLPPAAPPVAPPLKLLNRHHHHHRQYEQFPQFQHQSKIDHHYRRRQFHLCRLFD
jgi:hypothetical protein